jgi:hypothetical protein
MEGGIDLEAIFGGNVPCFTRFMAETRSSTSPTSSLQDLTKPVSFPLCAISVLKKCNGNGQISPDGSTINYTNAVGSGWKVTVTNAGVGNLYNPTVVDTLPDGTSATYAVNSSCGATPNCLASKASATQLVDFSMTCSGGTCTGSEPGGKIVVNPLNVTNTATDFAFTGPNQTGTKISAPTASSDFCSTTVQSALTVVKHCDPTHGGPVLVSNGTNVVVNVPFTAMVCAASGTGAEAINNITLSDTPTATLNPSSISSLAPGACASVTGNYFPSAISSGDGLVAGRYFFSDTITASGKGAIDGATVTQVGGVSCPICPSGECDGPLP